MTTPEIRERLGRTRLFVLDMDGTIYLGQRLFPWTLPFLERVAATGRDYLFLTNNSSRGASDYVTKLARLGVPAQPRHVFTSGQATAELLVSELGAGARVWALGTDELLAEFSRAGLVLDPIDPQVIVLGFDTTLTYAKLDRFCRLVREGRPYLATHPDLVCPTEAGPIPDAGGFLALIEAVTGRRPERVIGKPNPEILRAASRRTGVPCEQLAVIGDRLYTDVAGGLAVGALSILVLSGESTRDDVATSPHRPDWVVADLGVITEELQ
jgi:HAD superfamily hydrolase (TIGR01450 family)